MIIEFIKIGIFNPKELLIFAAHFGNQPKTMDKFL